MGDALEQNHGFKRSTTVIISTPNADLISKKILHPIVSESNLKPQLVRARDSNTSANQIKHIKAAAEDFKLMLAEKEEILTEMKVGIQYLKRGLRLLDDTIQSASGQVQEKRSDGLDLLRQEIKRAEEREESFNVYIVEGKRTIGILANMLADCESKARKENALKRHYDILANRNSTLNNLNKEQKQAIAEHGKLCVKKKFQLDEMERRKKEFFNLRIQFEKITGQGTTLKRQSKKLDARLLLELEELAKQVKKIPAGPKIEDSKRTVVLRSKQILETPAMRTQKKQPLDKPKPKLMNMVQECDKISVEVKVPEKSFKGQPIEIMHSPIMQSTDAPEIALKQAQDNISHKMPKLDSSVHQENDQGLEQVGVAGAAANSTTQTLSNVATDSNPANYHVETQQMQMTMPGFDSNSDCTTKFRKVVYSGRGIDMNVMNEAKRILEIHQQGVTREADETEEEFKLRKVLVKRAADLQKMMENSELAQNCMRSGQVLKTKQKRAVEEMTTAQTVFAQITYLLTRRMQDRMLLEADLPQDGQKISNT